MPRSMTGDLSDLPGMVGEMTDTAVDESLDTDTLVWYMDGRNVTFLARWAVDQLGITAGEVIEVYEEPWNHDALWSMAWTWVLENL